MSIDAPHIRTVRAWLELVLVEQQLSRLHQEDRAGGRAFSRPFAVVHVSGSRGDRAAAHPMRLAVRLTLDGQMKTILCACMIENISLRIVWTRRSSGAQVRRRWRLSASLASRRKDMTGEAIIDDQDWRGRQEQRVGAGDPPGPSAT